MNVVGDEHQFLLTCPAFRGLRIKYLRPYYCRWPTLNKFDRLMTSTSKTKILNLSKYIFFASKLKQELT